MSPSVRAAQRNSAIARSAGHIERSSPMPRRIAIGMEWRRRVVPSAAPVARSRVTVADMPEP